MFDAATITMMAWVEPTQTSVDRTHGMLMQKNGSYAMGINDDTMELLGMFSPCW